MYGLPPSNHCRPYRYFVSFIEHPGAARHESNAVVDWRTWATSRTSQFPAIPREVSLAPQGLWTLAARAVGSGESTQLLSLGHCSRLAQ